MGSAIANDSFGLSHASGNMQTTVSEDEINGPILTCPKSAAQQTARMGFLDDIPARVQLCETFPFLVRRLAPTFRNERNA
jgi:hypothetical protein